MKIETFSCSQRGSRAENQDKTGHYLGEHAACFVLCDGVAGDEGGARAASLACHFMLRHASQGKPCPPQDAPALIDQLQQVMQQAQSRESSRMRTTLVTLFIDRQSQQAHWIHAGDSRLYLFRNGYICQATRDHSLAQKMRDAGFQQGTAPDNLLYCALGDDTTSPSFSSTLDLSDGDAFLLCSDGFWQRYNVAMLEHTLRLSQSPQEWLMLIENLSSAQPSADNYSAIAVWVGSPQEATLLQMLPLDEHLIMPPSSSTDSGDTP
ncbi:serine/threonine-protein phosphatase [Enterobacteriaceae bacterium 4M9]|nr:serine/threonine-protein phosphatase [Enterobacteriaceae bacterium 4M9]